MDSSARMLRLLSLLQARPNWTGTELAERLEVTDRTLRRDVNRLRELGYPVEAFSGPAGGYHLAPGGSLPPLLFENDEAVAVALGLRSAASGALPGFEDAAVSAYCKERAPKQADAYIEVFRKQRKVLAPKQGQERTTWIQVVMIGDVAIVGVPAEFFMVLGQDIKRRSPFRYTYVAGLANDWIGYLPDRKAFELGGYQTWTGLHSYAAPGTGEAVVEEAVRLLRELAD